MRTHTFTFSAAAALKKSDERGNHLDAKPDGRQGTLPKHRQERRKEKVARRVERVIRTFNKKKEIQFLNIRPKGGGGDKIY